MNSLILASRRLALSNRRSFQTTAKRSGDNFRVLGLQQIAVGGLSKEKLASLWVDTLGLDKVGTYKSEKENVDEDILSLCFSLWSLPKNSKTLKFLKLAKSQGNFTF